MTFIILFAILALIGGGCLLGFVATRNDTDSAAPASYALGWGVCAILALILTGFATFHRVPNGNVGLVYTFGKITSQRGTGGGGMVLTWPWQSVEAADVQTQSECPDGSHPAKNACGGFAAFSSESIDVSVAAIINYRVSPEHIQTLYRTVGPDYAAKIILPREAQILKEETVKYSATDIAPRREEIRRAVAERLAAELSPRSVTVEDFLLTNIDFPNPEVKKSIDAKVIQAQNAQAAQAQVAVSEATARQQAAAAEGTASKTRIEAQGQSDANRLINASLTPELIQFQAVQKLAGNVQVALIPSGQGVIIDPTTFLKPLAK